MSSPRPVTVAVANDYEIVVQGVAAVLASYADRVAVVELDSGTTVAKDVDVVLYDTFSLPQADAVDLDELGGGARSRVLVFGWNTDPALVRRALEAGASGYVSKASTGETLVTAIERVHAGEVVAPSPEPEATELGDWPGRAEGLTAREAEVLALICRGLTNTDIAERAFIGVNTVKTHIRTLYRKIGVTSRSQAVGWGFGHGFDPDHVRHVRRVAEE